MRFQHAPEIWRSHPSLTAGVVWMTGVTPDIEVRQQVSTYRTIAERRLRERPISDFPEIQEWRRAFGSMGLKPTQYRCASESLLRRLHKHGTLPDIHPLVDLSNHVSASFAIPVAAFDLSSVAGNLEVRPAVGTESYATFSGGIEHPVPGEIIFADEAGRAHARRWTHRQSAASAIRADTSEVLIVAEALHDNGSADIDGLLATLTNDLADLWPVSPTSAVLTARHPTFTTA